MPVGSIVIISSFIPDIGNSSVLSFFFFLSFARGSSVLLIFSKNELLFSLIFVYYFSVFSLISALYFPFLLALDLFCSFSSFLRWKCRLQLTLEQQEFELRESIYMQIFFDSKYYSTTPSTWLVESMNVELQIQRN